MFGDERACCVPGMSTPNPTSETNAIAQVQGEIPSVVASEARGSNYFVRHWREVLALAEERCALIESLAQKRRQAKSTASALQNCRSKVEA